MSYPKDFSSSPPEKLSTVESGKMIEGGGDWLLLLVVAPWMLTSNLPLLPFDTPVTGMVTTSSCSLDAPLAVVVTLPVGCRPAFLAQVSSQFSSC